MGATFQRVKNWAREILTNEDLNAEIDNILNNLAPSGMDSYSTSIEQMRLTTDPGATGSEILATSLAGELERIRFVVGRLAGPELANWYDSPPATLTDLASSLGTGLIRNRIISGRTSASSMQLVALQPSGNSDSLTLLGEQTPFVYTINGTQYTIDEDITITGLGLAPSSNNTCVVADAQADDGQLTKMFGQYGTRIYIGSIGTEITARIGQMAAFRKGSEYFIATPDISNQLVNAFRGCFFDSLGEGIGAETLDDADTITLMRLTWIFATTARDLTVAYNTPYVGALPPSAPNVGDYWFDTIDDIWKRFDSTVWVDAQAALIGISVQDTADCIGARTFDQFRAFSAQNSIQTLHKFDDETVQAHTAPAIVDVFGNTLNFGSRRLTWRLPDQLDAVFSEAASTIYFLYLTERGQRIISPVAPMNRNDLFGFYHPHETWRCVGHAFNDSGSDIRVDVHPALVNRDMPLYNNTGVWLSTGASAGTTSTTFVALANLVVNIRTTGTRPVIVTMTPAVGSGDDNGYVRFETTGAGTAWLQLRITEKSTGTPVSLPAIRLGRDATGATDHQAGGFTWLVNDFINGQLMPGDYKLEIFGRVAGAAMTVTPTNCRLMAYEI